MNTFCKLTDFPEHSPTDDQVLADFDRRYMHTYMIFKEKEKEDLVYMSRLLRAGVEVYSMVNGDTYEIPYKTEGELIPFLPEVGYYNILGLPYYVYKNPQRQWKRSFHKGIYVIVSPRSWKDSRQDANSLNSWNESATAIYNAEYVDLDCVSHSLFGNIALSKDFALLRVGNNVHLLYRRYTVGTLDFHNHVIRCTQPLFYQEISDLLRNTRTQQWMLS